MSLVSGFRHALPVNKSLFYEAFFLTHAGWDPVKPEDSLRREDGPMYSFEWNDGRILPEFCLALLTGGSGEYETSHSSGKIHAGDSFLFRPGEWHRHRPLRDGWTILWINFNGNDPLLWLRNDSFKMNGNVPIVENKDLYRAQFEYLLECVHRDPSTNSLAFSRQAVGLLSHFVIETPSDGKPGIQRVQDKAVRAAVEFIWNFSHDVVDVALVAEKIGLARRTLDYRFRMATGHSVLDEIQFCRVSRAVTLLEETDLSIKEIIYRAGFRSDEHLRLTFQKTFGKSPFAYRAEFHKPGHHRDLQKPHRRRSTDPK